MLKRPENVPDVPGSYQFLDGEKKLIYVGKAKSLKKRLATYFGKRLDAKTMQMMQQAASVEWIIVETELEALLLEFNLIQRHRPRFNVHYRDDKSYPYLAITLQDEWPRPMVMRGKHKSGNRYFGPYTSAYAIRETLDLLLRTFPLRTCSDNKFKQHEKMKRPCLLFHIQKCAGPCAGKIKPAKYQHLVKDFSSFLSGNTEEPVEKLETEMAQYVKKQNYEMAARVRDQIANINRVMESQLMVGTRMEDFDVIGWEDQELETAVQVFFVRKGRVMGQRGFIMDKPEPLNQSELAGRVLGGIYYTKNPLGAPKKVFLPNLPSDIELYEQWLTEQRGTPVRISIPQRGDKRQLAETVTKNAVESMLRHSLKRATDYNSRARALNELKDDLNLTEAPLRIECYDTSHLSGTDYVGSMVVLEDGLPKNRDYRRFVLKDVKQNDDYAAMYELLTRRFSRYVEAESKVAKSGSAALKNSPSSFSYTPGLLLIDGGKGQLSVAIRVLKEFGLYEKIPVAALAKELEEVFIPKQKESIKINRQSAALYLLQTIRDESHRVAVSHHRKRRSSSMLESFLDDISGLGPARKKRLLKEMRNLKNVREATLSDLQKLSWLPDEIALEIYEKAQLGKSDNSPKSK